MATRRVVVGLAGGVHARPAAALARLAQGHPTAVTLTSPRGEHADLGHVLGVMNLDLLEGEEVTLHAEGAGADALLDELAAVFGSADG